MQGVLKLRPSPRGGVHDAQGHLPAGIGRPQLQNDGPLPGLRAQGGHLLQKRGLGRQESGRRFRLHNPLEVHHPAVVGGILALFRAEDQPGVVHGEPAVRGPLADLQVRGVGRRRKRLPHLDLPLRLAGGEKLADLLGRAAGDPGLLLASSVLIHSVHHHLLIPLLRSAYVMRLPLLVSIRVVGQRQQHWGGGSRFAGCGYPCHSGHWDHPFWVVTLGKRPRGVHFILGSSCASPCVPEVRVSIIGGQCVYL
mmetsp:Transcript_27343/g.65935  ORF Transcript_27343/g.65935 Transcript_27343/m.65935 type:complete len:252 (+) Transcript_27343:72-827(+)